MRNLEERSMKMHALLAGLHLNVGKKFEFFQYATCISPYRAERCTTAVSYIVWYTTQISTNVDDFRY
jgi:hypothetical protein